jgi:hypothetical protein
MEIYAVEANQEGFTETDVKSLKFESAEMESIEAESVEGASLEDIRPESIAKSLSGLMEGAEAYSYGNGYNRRSPSSSVNKQLLKTFTIIIKKLVKKIISNPRTRAKLQAAARLGPTATIRLITPSVAQVLPSYFRWMVPIYVPLVTAALFVPICKQIGVELEQVGELEAARRRPAGRPPRPTRPPRPGSRPGSRPPKPPRPHGSKTDIFGNIIGGGGLIIDVINLTKPK